MDVMQDMPDDAVHLSLYSPPFGGIYTYSSSDRDLSNHAHIEDFFEHYEIIVRELARVTMPGRMSAVHCMDIPRGGYGNRLMDLPGEIIRMYEPLGWHYVARYHVWKEPLAVRNRTMMKSLHHKTLCEDTSRCAIANADYLLIFRRHGENPVPVEKPNGLLDYAGARRPPAELLKYRGWEGDQTKNRYSHWIWQQYASAFWDDVRTDRVLPHKKAREHEDEKHLHPLQLDVIERAVVLWTNEREVVFSPFMGVGSEVYGAVMNGRRGVGVELKPSYYAQAVANVEQAEYDPGGQLALPIDAGTDELARVL